MSTFIRLALVLLISFGVAVADNQNPVHVPLVSLIVNSSKYQAKFVQTSGYLEYSDGIAVLYLSEETEKHGVLENSLWISFDKKQHVDGYASKWVIVQGLYSAEFKGEFDACAGSLQVSAIQSAPR